MSAEKRHTNDRAVPMGMGPMSRIDRRRLLQGTAGLGAASALNGGLSVSTSRLARAQADPATFTMSASPNDLDPHSQYDYNSVVAVRGMYEGLIGLKGSSLDEYEGLIAESWEPNEDLSVWTFQLRENVTFQDGSPCDAEAVLASYQRLLSMQKGAWNVVGRFVTDPAMMSAPDPRTVVFDLGRPQPQFESAMAATYGPQVVNVKVAMEHEVDGDMGNAWMMATPEGTGTGPYRITEYLPGELTTLERYEGYWGGWEGNHFEQIVLRVVDSPETLRELLENGDIDLANRFHQPPSVVDDLEQTEGLVVDRQPSIEVVYFIMTEAGPLVSKEARQALSYAFPYEEVIQGFYEGLATQPRGLVADTVKGFNPAVPQYTTDLVRAKDLFTTAGVTEGSTISIMYQDTQSNDVIGTLFQANLQEIGIELEIQRVDNGTLISTIYGELPAEERPSLMLLNWWPDYNDAWNQLDPLVRCEPRGTANAGYYCNEEVDRLLDVARDAATDEEYQEAISQLQMILHDDPSAVYFAQPIFYTILRDDIQGYAFNAINLGQVDFYKVSRATE